jgi:hypothetical protein
MGNVKSNIYLAWLVEISKILYEWWQLCSASAPRRTRCTIYHPAMLKQYVVQSAAEEKDP